MTLRRDCAFSFIYAEYNILKSKLKHVIVYALRGDNYILIVLSKKCMPNQQSPLIISPSTSGNFCGITKKK